MEGLPEGGLVFQKVPDTQHTLVEDERESNREMVDISLLLLRPPFFVFALDGKNASMEGL